MAISVRNGTLTSGSATVISVTAPTHASPVAQTYLTRHETHRFRESYGEIEVLNVDGTDAIYFRADGTNPTVGGQDCHVVPAFAGASLKCPVGGTTITVRLISASSTKYSVEFR